MDEKQIRADERANVINKMNELEKSYKDCYGTEILEMYAEIFSDLKQWLKLPK